jgi:transcriptional regulator GlxA family with amidase domain
VPLAPRTIVVGVRLRPGAAPGVLGPAVSELSEHDTPLADIWAAEAVTLSAQVSEAPAIDAKLAAAQTALARRLADAGPPEPSMAAATRWLARNPAGRIEDLARFLDMGGRRLHRRFVGAVGYGPKTYQRVLRLQRVMALAGGGQRPAGLAMLALDAGYADQAHMSRELRALTGRSPRGLLEGASSTLALSDFFKTEATSAFY